VKKRAKRKTSKSQAERMYVWRGKLMRDAIDGDEKARKALLKYWGVTVTKHEAHE